MSITPPAIESWEVLDLLASLVQKSLVLYEEDEQGRGRYRLLETVRQYARDRLLEAAEGEAVRERHRDWFLALAEHRAPGESDTRWLDRLEREHDNLRTALAWSRAQGQGEAGLRLGGALGWFWHVRGYLGEGQEHLAGLLALPGAEACTATRAYALAAAGGRCAKRSAPLCHPRIAPSATDPSPPRAPLWAKRHSRPPGWRGGRCRCKKP